MCNGIMFPSLPVSLLYGTAIMTLFDDVFRFAVITKWLLLKLMEFIFTTSMRFSSWSGSCSLLWTALPLALLQTCQKWFILLYFVHLFLYAWLMAGSIVFAILLCGHFNRSMHFSPILLLFISYCLFLVKLFHLTLSITH